MQTSTIVPRTPPVDVRAGTIAADDATKTTTTGFTVATGPET